MEVLPGSACISRKEGEQETSAPSSSTGSGTLQLLVIYPVTFMPSRAITLFVWPILLLLMAKEVEKLQERLKNETK